MRGIYKRRENNGRVDEERVERCQGKQEEQGEQNLFMIHDWILPHTASWQGGVHWGRALHSTSHTPQASSEQQSAGKPKGEITASASCLNFPPKDISSRNIWNCKDTSLYWEESFHITCTEKYFTSSNLSTRFFSLLTAFKWRIFVHFTMWFTETRMNRLKCCWAMTTDRIFRKQVVLWLIK